MYILFLDTKLDKHILLWVLHYKRIICGITSFLTLHRIWYCIHIIYIIQKTLPKCKREIAHLRDRSTQRPPSHHRPLRSPAGVPSAPVIWSASRLFVFMQQANRFQLWNLLICIQTKPIIYTDPTSITQSEPAESTQTDQRDSKLLKRG